MLACKPQESWIQFLEFIEKRCSPAEFQNWLAPVRVIDSTNQEIILEVPNIFVREYILENYKEALRSFFPIQTNGELAIQFVINEQKKVPAKNIQRPPPVEKESPLCKLNPFYTFENFIEGPSNQFVKTAACSVASRPGKAFNPLFIHGGVGLGKTHLLHGIGHDIQKNLKKLTVQCITTEAFINDLVQNLKNKSVEKMKNFYRTLDVLIVDDIQFLQNRLSFEEEFCNTFETLINLNKQIVIASDKPPSQLKLSERMIGRMEWGLVAHIDVPELETRVAIIQHKVAQRDFSLPQPVAFFIADRVFHNVRQLEGAINRLNAYYRLTKKEITQEIAEQLLSEMFDHSPRSKISVENILKSVAAVFELRVSDLKGDSRLKEIALARQVAMYLAKELINESLMKIASSFGGKTHSTLLHAWKKISEEVKVSPTLSRQIQMARKNIEG
ncbi:MAG: chromosomal replication initiator protein DnaA [Chlamydiota bacterium]